MILGDILQEVDATIALISQEEAVIMFHHKIDYMLEQGLKFLAERNLLPRIKGVDLPKQKMCDKQIT